MGSDSSQRTEEKKSISEVMAQFNQLKTELEEKNVNNLPVLVDTLQLMASAIETIQNFHRERTEVPISSVEYAQTCPSLTKYKGIALSYLENQENRYRDMLYEISGHIVDRVSYKALEWGGKTALKQHYDQQKKNIDELAAIVILLKSSAKTLNQYVNDQATDTLHADYFQDYKKYSNRSLIWLFLSLTLGGGICMVSSSIDCYNSRFHCRIYQR